MVKKSFLLVKCPGSSVLYLFDLNIATSQISSLGHLEDIKQHHTFFMDVLLKMRIKNIRQGKKEFSKNLQRSLSYGQKNI